MYRVLFAFLFLTTLFEKDYAQSVASRSCDKFRFQDSLQPVRMQDSLSFELTGPSVFYVKEFELDFPFSTGTLFFKIVDMDNRYCDWGRFFKGTSIHY
jgi:hypothetical protein